MKYILAFLTLTAAIILWPGCQKCYKCQNTCQKCVLTDSSGHVYTRTVCVDSFTNIGAFNETIAKDSALGFVCTAGDPTYTHEFCSNKPGTKTYPTYFTEGGRATCTPK